MSQADSHDSAAPVYRYSFGTVEFDEARYELRVGGLVVDLEQRPLQVLALLLRHVDEVVTREELFATVWAGRPTVDNVLANAVTKLRKALGPQSSDRLINVPRIGYRLCGPVARSVAGRRVHSHMALVAGQPVPGRDHFLLDQLLASVSGGEVWLAQHRHTGERRVYKFATEGQRLAALKREATLFRVLLESLGPRDDLVRVMDWNFETAPFYLECEYGGVNLSGWAATPALQALDSMQRLELFAQIAAAVAAAHSVGVLHKDLKPANILVQQTAAGWQTRIADFGSGRMLDRDRLAALDITALGLTVTHAMTEDSSGTPLYLAPELLSGQAPTVQSDLFALGLILYQLLVGDMRRPLAPGWEADIPDDLLREDVAAATDVSPARRLGSVAELCERLRGREARLLDRRRLRDAEARARLAEQHSQRDRARRPWILAAGAALVLGLVLTLWQYRHASRARDEAIHQAQIATAINQFLNEDLLGAGIGGDSPAWYESNPRLGEILDTVAGRVEQRYPHEPLLAASLHQTLGRAYRSTGAYRKAAQQLQTAADLLRRNTPAGDARSVLADYELAGTLGRVSQYAQAAALLDQADARAGAQLQRPSELSLRSSLARGDLLYQQMQVRPALAAYQQALKLQPLVRPDDALTAAHVQLSIAGCELRLNRAADAERIARRILAGAPYTQERVGLSTLALARSRLGDALRAQSRYDEAIPVLTQALADYSGTEGADGQGALSVLSSLGYVYSLKGDLQQALAVQRQVYERTRSRWGERSQYTLVELMNLGSAEYDLGDLHTALRDLSAAEKGLTAVSGPHSPTTQAARVAMAAALTDLHDDAHALALIESVDPAAYQATTSDPGRAAVLKAMHAGILLDMKRREQGRAELLQAVQDMQGAGVSAEEIAPYLKTLQGA